MSRRTEDTLADPASPEAGDAQMANLQLFTSGSVRFAVSSDDIATIAEWRRPTPLPQAPPAVLGVVSIQGRMLTVLDPAVLLGRSDNGNSLCNFIVALRGDEQLALAVDDRADTQLTEHEITPQSGPAEGAVLGVINHNDEAITVLNVKQLFALAIHGRERRRRRF